GVPVGTAERVPRPLGESSVHGVAGDDLDMAQGPPERRRQLRIPLVQRQPAFQVALAGRPVRREPIHRQATLQQRRRYLSWHADQPPRMLVSNTPGAPTFGYAT